jgi:uncharacterized protein YicC (UPF0701 family)
MGIATEMKKLTQDIAASDEGRLIRVGEIKRESTQLREQAQDLVKNLATSRRYVGTRLRKDLAQETARRESEVKRMLEEAERLVQGFNRLRKEEGTRMRNELAEGVAKLRSEVKGILADAQKTENSFRSHRKKTGSELRKELARSKASNKSAVGQIVKDARKLLADFHGAQRELRAELQEARAAWQGLAATRVKVAPKVKPPLAKEKAAEVAVAEEGTPDLEVKLLATINAYPNGISLIKVAESLGVVPVVLGRAAKSLVERGKVRKEDKSYFPITS